MNIASVRTRSFGSVTRAWVVTGLVGGALSACSSSGSTTDNVAGEASPAEIASGDRSEAVAPACVAPTPGTVLGFATGETLGDLVFQDCSGQTVRLSELCAKRPMWIHVAHLWCPYVNRTSPQLEGLQAEYAATGLTTVEVVYENRQRRAPTAEDCVAWKTSNGMNAVVTLFDQTGAAAALFDTPRTNLSVFVDRNGRIASKSHRDDAVSLRAELAKIVP